MDREAEIDRLYALPLGEFVAARNALAKALRAAGDRAAADEVKALAKPSVTAWAVNRLWHEERERFERLLDAGAAERAALAKGAGAREAGAARRAALKELVAAAKEQLAGAGNAFSPAARQRVSHTLEALAARDADGAEPPPGRLTRDLEPPGFAALAGLALAPAGGGKIPRPAKRAPKPAPKRPPTAPRGRADAAERKREAERQALAEREAELAELEGREAAARRRLAAAQRAAADAAGEAAEAERLARQARADAEARRQAEAEAKAAARAARSAAGRARAKVATARRRLEKLS